MKKIEKGTRVIGIEEILGIKIEGMKGIVLDVDEELTLPILIEFDESNPRFHDGNLFDGRGGKDKHCYWVNRNNVKPISMDFDWEEYLANKVWVHLESDEEAKDFCAKDEKHNRWGNRYRYFERGNTYICANGYSNDAQVTDLKKVEWSDYMKKNLKDTYLKSGYVVATRAGSKYFVVRNGDEICLMHEEGYGTFNGWKKDTYFNEDLKYHQSTWNEFDIVAVYPKVDCWNDVKNVDEPIWEREELKEVSKEEAFEVLKKHYDVSEIKITE